MGIKQDAIVEGFDMMMMMMLVIKKSEVFESEGENEKMSQN